MVLSRMALPPPEHVFWLQYAFCSVVNNDSEAHVAICFRATVAAMKRSSGDTSKYVRWVKWDRRMGE